MIQAQVKKQFDAAIENVEDALRDLSERLESLSRGGRSHSTMRRAGRNLKRRAGSFAEHVPLERASAFAAETGRTVRRHPVTTVLAAAVAGYCIWSLVQYATHRTSAGQRPGAPRHDFPGKGEGTGESAHRVVVPGESESVSRH